MYVCMYVCMHVYIYIYICMYVCMYVCVCVYAVFRLYTAMLAKVDGSPGPMTGTYEAKPA